MAGLVYDGLNYPSLQLARASGIFEQVAAEELPMSLLTATSARTLAAPRTIGFATHDLFGLLGVHVTEGRGFSPQDDRRGAPVVGILTDSYWRRAFDGRSDAIGGTVTVAGKPVTIVGVAQPGFNGLDLSLPIDIYLPLHAVGTVGSLFNNYFAETTHGSSPYSGTKIIGLLRTRSNAGDSAARLSAAVTPAGQPAVPLVLTRIDEDAIPMVARGGMQQFGRLLGTTVALLLVIGCGTVGMLLLIRTEARREELAMCVALGASRVRLARGIVFEGAILALAGAICAVPVAWWLFRGIETYQLPGGVDIAHLGLGIGAASLLATAAAAVLASLTISVIAATFGLTARTSDTPRAWTGATPRIGRRRTRAALVTAQVAVALVLVVGAGLFTRSLAAALSLNTGLDMGRLVTGSVNLAPYGYNAVRAAAFFDDLRDRLRANAAVVSVAYGLDQGGMLGSMTIDGVPRTFPTQIAFSYADERYFRTLGIHIVAGRDFTPADGPGAPRVTIVSESFGRALAGGGSPLGMHVMVPFHRMGKPAGVMEVVGVAKDIITRVSELNPLTMYFPMAQTDAGLSRSISVRAAGDPTAASREVLRAIMAIDPAVSPSALLTVEDRIGRQMAAQRFGAVVMGTLGTIALLLTILGTYVLAESMAAMRLREMGIRAALGATGRQLGSIVIAESGRLVGYGLAVGLALAWAGASTIRAFLFQVQPLDPLTLVAVAGSILILALTVSLRPALRAARVDLGSVLKEM